LSLNFFTCRPPGTNRPNSAEKPKLRSQGNKQAVLSSLKTGRHNTFCFHLCSPFPRYSCFIYNKNKEFVLIFSSTCFGLTVLFGHRFTMHEYVNR